MLAASTFVIDPQLSHFTLSGNADGFEFTEQAPGSMTTALEGTINTDLGVGTLQFLSGSAIDAIEKPGNFLPGDKGADFAGQVLFHGVDLGYAAARTLVGSATSGVLAIDPQGNFTPTGMNLSFTSGRISYEVPSLDISGSESLVGYSAENISLGASTLTPHGLGLKLVVSIDATYHFYEPFLDSMVDLTVIGQVVGFNVDPYAPVAQNDAYEVDEDGTLAVDAIAGVGANDSDPQNDPLEFELVEGPAQGQVVLQTNGSFTYEPAADFYGTDVFYYRAFDGTNYSQPAAVTITVHPLDDPPVAVDDRYFSLVDGSLSVDAAAGVLANDPNVDDDAWTVALVAGSGPAHGSLTLHPDGSFEYVPTPGFFGTDSFRYTASDAASESNEATVDLLVGYAPTAGDESYETDEDVALVVLPEAGVLANDDDSLGLELTAELVDLPAHGTLVLSADGSFEYMPAADYFGADSFTYRPSNGFVTGPLTTVEITIHPILDLPTGQVDVYQTAEDTPLAIGGTTASLVEDFSGLVSPELEVGGTLVVADGVARTTDNTYSYLRTVQSDFHQRDFRFEVTFTNIATSQTNVKNIGLGEGVYSEPDFGAANAVFVRMLSPNTANGEVRLAISGESQLVIGHITTNGEHRLRMTKQGQSLTFEIDEAYDGTFVPDISYTLDQLNQWAPFLDASNSRLFAGSGNPNDYLEDLHISQFVGGPAVLENDTNAESGSFTATLMSPPTHGQLDFYSDGTFVYTPDANFHGADSFVYRAMNVAGESADTMVQIDVLAVNDKPLGQTESYHFASDTTLHVDANNGVLTNDLDVEEDPLTAVLLTTTAHGTLQLADDGSFVYTPEPGFAGTDSFTYVPTDASTSVTIYTIDTLHDTLVKIDSITGLATTVGPIGHDINEADLAYLDGIIYAVSADGPDLFSMPGFTLVAIDPATGAKLSSVPITFNGQDVAIAESITAAQGKLIVGFHHIGLTAGFLGEIDPATGAVTLLANQGNSDWDGLGTTVNGQIYSVDVRGYSGNTRQITFWRLGYNPSSVEFVGDFLADNGLMDDIAFFGDRAFGVDRGRRELLILGADPLLSGWLGSVPLGTASANYRGTIIAPDLEPTRITVNLVVEGPPTADAGGPYVGTEATTMQLSGGGAGAIDLYEWDLDNDGEFDDATGPTADFMADDNGQYTVGLRVTSIGGSAIDTTTITIGSAPPETTIEGPVAGKADVEHTFVLTATDLSLADQQGSFTYEIDWGNDGTFDETVHDDLTVEVNHTFATAGSHQVGVRAIDKDGAAGPLSIQTVHVFSLTFVEGAIIWEGSGGNDSVEFVQTAPATVEVRTLRVGGSGALYVDTYENGESVRALGHGGNDRIDAGQLLDIPVYFEGGFGNDTLIGGDAGDIIKGEFDGASGDGAEGNDWIEGRGGWDLLYGDGADGGEGGADTILGGEGSDVLWGDGGDGAEGRADSLIGGEGNDHLLGHTGDDVLDGGAGNDRLVGGRDGSEGNDTIRGGSGNDILVGGRGNDYLVATSGMNLLLGGGGSDTLVAGGGGDILVADAIDNDLTLTALAAIRSEWTSGNDYADRISAIRSGNVIDGVALATGDTVVDDGAVDELMGNSQVELNWYIYNLAFDQITGRHASEAADDTNGT